MAEDDAPPEPDRLEGCPHPRETVDLFGQEAAERAFLDAWSGGRLHHAWLLAGPRGTGKATLAYRIARTLIGFVPDDGLFGAPETPQTLAPPPDCPVAQRIAAQSEPRLFVLRRTPHPDTGRMRGEVTVDNVRRLRGFLNLSATDGGWRAVIVDAADELNTSAANALLKSLEEPPPRVVFLLVAHAPAGLLPTIRSRCRTLTLTPLQSSAVTRVLATCGIEAAGDEAQALAALSAGSAARAITLAAGDGLALYDTIVSALSGGQVNRTAMSALAEQSGARGAEQRWTQTLDLIQTLTARMARAAAGGLGPAASVEEPALAATAAQTPAQARIWAEATATIAATARTARAVNLDPAQTIIDIFLELDTVLARARGMAA